MKHADREITVFNFYSSPDDPNRFYSKRTNIRGASVFAQTKVEVTKEGLISGDVYTIRIPESAPEGTYVPPLAFRLLSDKTGVFTLQAEDKIVLGRAMDDNPKASELEERYGSDMVVTVTGVTDNRDGIQPHWKVIGE